MKFGLIPTLEAEGAILAHATITGDVRLKKAHRLTAKDVSDLLAAGTTEVVAAVLAPDDIEENEAATRVAQALRFYGVEAKPATTGRVNLHALTSGLFTVDKAVVDAINRVDPDVTIATLTPFASVVAGQMVATVKIIPFAVGIDVVETIVAIAANGTTFAVHEFRPLSVGVIQTVLPSVKASVLDKTLQVTDARLARSGSTIYAERRTAHSVAEVTAAIEEMAAETDMVLVIGASAMSDPGDVIPAAIRASGGTVFRSGMPVDPGNLFVLGERQGKPVLGAPGCARSPKPNGFDWVLDRLTSDVGITADDIAGMGVGGLLMEIPARPQPREAPSKSRKPSVEIVVLAGGRSSRMGGPNKLMAHFEGKPLIRRTVERALEARVAGVTVVTGHQAERIGSALSGLGAGITHNPDFASGLAGSLKAGIARLIASGADGALVVLGDMPGVTTADLNLLISAFEKSGGLAIVRAGHDGRRGNPVLLPRSLFPAIATLEGDTGARHVVENSELEIIDLEIGPGAAIDVDTRDALANAGGVLQD